MKYKLEFPFRSISGVMDRQIDRHGNDEHSSPARTGQCSGEPIIQDNEF